MKIDVLIAEGFEETEAVAVIDLLNRAGYQVTLVSIHDRKEVTGGHHIRVICDSLIGDYDFSHSDMLFLPGGGKGVENLLSSHKVIETVQSYHQSGRYVAAICAAPQVLEKAGVLKGQKVTSFPSVKDSLKSIGQYLEDRVVVDGKLITSRGLGTAIDLGLGIIELISGNELKEKIRISVVYQV